MTQHTDTYPYATEPDWRTAWQQPAFRRTFYITLGAFGLLLLAFPFFFQAIQARQGTFLNDWLLNHLPPQNASLIIFAFLWLIMPLLAFRARRSPALFVTFLSSYVLVNLVRMATIGLFPLEPPSGLIPLVDPISNYFYGESYITKDLFFSGHTSTLVLAFLSLKKPLDRIFAGIGMVVVGFLVLVQHVHYTIDVAAAFLLTVPLFYLARNWALSGWFKGQ